VFYERLGKRVLDLVVAVPALIVLSPVLAVVAAAIWLHDRGPAIFRQERAGAHDVPFVLMKFRSMPVSTPNVESAQAGTLQITPVGRVIRRTSLDELPQLFNVVKGEMSLIGPRPALPSQTDVLALRRANGSIRLKPGLTGLAQLNGYDEMPVVEKAGWDGRYAEQLGLRTDIELLVKTPGYVLHPPPVY